MPVLRKLLSKFGKGERRAIETLIERVVSFDWHSLNIRKLKGHQNFFRVRKGRIRIIFIKDGKNIFILSIDRRRESTYRL